MMQHDDPGAGLSGVSQWSASTKAAAGVNEVQARKARIDRDPLSSHGSPETLARQSLQARIVVPESQLVEGWSVLIGRSVSREVRPAERSEGGRCLLFTSELRRDL